MFVAATKSIQEAVYGVWGRTRIDKQNSSHGTGTGFMIYPGVIATCAHVIHQKGDVKNLLHDEFLVIRAPDIGKQAQEATVIAESPSRDIALLRVTDPTNDACATLEPYIVPRGTPVGSLGFPLARVAQEKKRTIFNLVLRFQSAYISSYKDAEGSIESYETDSLMYPGSSGCPGFLENGNVWGMHNSARVQPDREGNGPVTRLAISNWVPSMKIRELANNHGVPV